MFLLLAVGMYLFAGWYKISVLFCVTKNKQLSISFKANLQFALIVNFISNNSGLATIHCHWNIAGDAP